MVLPPSALIGVVDGIHNGFVTLPSHEKPLFLQRYEPCAQRNYNLRRTLHRGVCRTHVWQLLLEPSDEGPQHHRRALLRVLQPALVLLRVVGLSAPRKKKGEKNKE